MTHPDDPTHEMDEATKQAIEEAKVGLSRVAMSFKVYDGDNWPKGEPVPAFYNAQEGFPHGYWVVCGSTGNMVGASRFAIVPKGLKGRSSIHEYGE